MNEIIQIRSTAPPIVEIDTTASAAYVRFSRNQVARTKRVKKPGIVITIDFDAGGAVVGIELIGVRDFEIRQLLSHAPVSVTRHNLLNNARYVSAGHREEVEA